MGQRMLERSSPASSGSEVKIFRSISTATTEPLNIVRSTSWKAWSKTSTKSPQ